MTAAGQHGPLHANRRPAGAGEAGELGSGLLVVGVSLRQAIVPDRLVDRVVSADRMLAYGAAPVGAILGGGLGRTLGLRAPFLLGAAIVAAAGRLALPAVNNHRSGGPRRGSRGFVAQQPLTDLQPAASVGSVPHRSQRSRRPPTVAR